MELDAMILVFFLMLKGTLKNLAGEEIKAQQY